MIHKSTSTVRNALYYQRLNRRIKDLVIDKKTNYTTAVHFARIPNKNSQLIEYARWQRDSTGNAGNYVSSYLANLEAVPTTLELTGEKIGTRKKKSITGALKGLLGIIKKLQYIVENDGKTTEWPLIKSDRFRGNLSDVGDRLESLNKFYADDERYRPTEKPKSLLDELLDSNIKIDSKEEAVKGLNLADAEYRRQIDINEIYPSKEQPRKTIDTDNFNATKRKSLQSW